MEDMEFSIYGDFWDDYFKPDLTIENTGSHVWKNGRDGKTAIAIFIDVYLQNL